MVECGRREASLVECGRRAWYWWNAEGGHGMMECGRREASLVECGRRHGIGGMRKEGMVWWNAEGGMLLPRGERGHCVKGCGGG